MCVCVCVCVCVCMYVYVFVKERGKEGGREGERDKRRGTEEMGYTLGKESEKHVMRRKHVTQQCVNKTV